MNAKNHIQSSLKLSQISPSLTVLFVRKFNHPHIFSSDHCQKLRSESILIKRVFFSPLSLVDQENTNVSQQNARVFGFFFFLGDV